MVCSFSASAELSRFGGRLSKQARYWSCRSTRVATAAAQRLDRGARRRVGAAGEAGRCWRSLARRRTCRSAELIGIAPMRVWAC
jgi:hypothetical protein